MPFIGNQPTAVPLSGADLTDGIITPAKLSTTLDLSSKTITLPAGVGGKVLQVVTNTTGTSTYTTNTTWTQTALFVNITPSSSSNKILVMADGNLDSAVTATLGHASIFRDSTNLGNSTGGMLVSYGQNSRVIAGATPTILDSPNSTATITYRVYVKATGSAVDWNGQSCLASITAMEISA